MRGTRTTWVAALLSLFLVLVLPACVTGALVRAKAVPGQTSSNGNTNEEREERDSVEEIEVVRRASRPPDDLVSPPPSEVSYLATPPPKEVVAKLAPIPHPSRYSERRLN